MTPVHFLHLGKTGGTAVKHALLEHSDPPGYRILLHGHDVRLFHVPEGEKFMFVVRDPIARFVSAFNGRLREDRPRYYYPWLERERQAFAVFRTPDQLATTLSAADDAERERAEQAMTAIGHLNTSYWYWFGDESTFHKRLPDLVFVAFQERLGDDFEILKSRLGLPPDLHLPVDEELAHRTPSGFDTSLSPVAVANLERWYERDLAFVDLCRRLAPFVNARRAAVPARTHAPAVVAPASRVLSLAIRLVLALLACAATFSATAALVEALTDRDWSLSDSEWPLDSMSTAVLVSLLAYALHRRRQQSTRVA